MHNHIYLTILLFVFASNSFAQDYNVSYHEQSKTIVFEIQDLSLRSINHDDQEFTKIEFDGSVSTNKKGYAEVPFLHASLSMDPLKNIKISVSYEEFEDHQLEFPLVPSRGVIYRNQDPDKIPFKIAPESLVDSFYPKSLTRLIDPFIIKDVRGTTVYVYPFRYNAVSQSLRVYKNITLLIEEDNSIPINPLINTSGKVFKEMEGIYASVFINYQNQVDDLSVAEAGDILVLTTARDETAIQPFIDWKREKGYNVFKEVVTTGTNVKSLIQQKYNTNPDILYVQLVGDWADIKCDLGTSENAPMDPMLGCVAGSDYYPDIAIGRFSASNASQLTVQVNKILNYEKNPSGDWYADAIGVASNQGPGDDNEMDYQHVQIIYDSKLDPFTWENYNFAYDPYATSTMVKGYIEAGAGVINYCGHGSMTSWGSSGFSNSTIYQLTNGNMLPFIFSVACLNGKFHAGECFAEAWLKKENGGAVMTLMSTINQPWDPPMRGQDYFNDLLTGGYDYDLNTGNGINTSEGRTTIGSIVANGLTLMYTESNSTSDLETIQTWTTFGDPSMQVRTKVASAITLSNITLFTGSPFSTTISGGGKAIEGAMVCLSQNGNYSSAYTDASGTVTLPNNFAPGDVQLVVTAFNAETVYQTIENVPQAGPFISFISAEINDENGQLDCGETAGLNVTLENVGIEAATNLMATLSCSDPLIEINSGIANFGSITAGEISTLNDAFEIAAAGNIPDGHNCVFQISVTDGNQSWDYSFNIMAHAPIFEMEDYYLNDESGNNNGKLDPGESCQLTIIVGNAGSSGATGVLGTLATLSPYITITDAEMIYGDILPGNTAQAIFEVSVNNSTPSGTVIDFSFEIKADCGLTTNTNFSLIVGHIPVLIINMDGNSNSTVHIAQSLADLGIVYDESTTISGNLGLYSTIFLSLGIYNQNHVITATEGTLLAAYLSAGGNLYIEGGDTWAYDSQTAVHSMFGISGVADGTSDMEQLLGQAGSITEGLTFFYNGDNNYMDHIEAMDGAELILANQSPFYGCGIANDAGTYKTIGTSFEFGGITNSKSSRNELMEVYASFFGLINPDIIIADFSASPTEIPAGETIYFTNLSTGPMVSCGWDFDNDGIIDSEDINPSFIYSEAGIYSVKLTVWDADGNSAEMIREDYIQVMAPLLNFQPVWESPFNPMSIYVTQAKVNGIDLEAGAQIGVFDIDPNTGNEICVGASTLTGIINEQDFLEIIASMNDGSNPDDANGFTPGNDFIFKIIDNENGLVESVDCAFPFPGYDEVFTTQGSAIVNLSANAVPPQQQIITLTQGWNAVSSYLAPTNASIQQMVNSIVPQLEFINNTNGFYQPGNSESNLLSWNYKSGYFVKTSQTINLTIFGFTPEDKAIPLQTGWNLISVISEKNVEIINLFGENLQYIEIVKEAIGVNIYWPEKGIATLKTLQPGKAYLVRVTQGFTITY